MLITLLTDFGTADYFVAAMKGVILSINPNARLIDITHEIPPHDIQAGAFTLAAAYRAFPGETIHVAVVDPGVGSARRPILVSAGNQFFIGPDNGLFSYVHAGEGDARVFHITNKEYFRDSVSATFHGRDVFAPIAAALSLGGSPEQFGTEIKDYALLPNLQPRWRGENAIEASIIHIDRFGNCITNLTRKELRDAVVKRGVHLVVNGAEITSIRSFFEEGRGADDPLFAIWGSAGYLEVVAFGTSAAEVLGVERGHPVIATLSE